MKQIHWSEHDRWLHPRTYGGVGECARGGRRVVQEAVAARRLLPLLPRPVPGRNNLTLLYNDPVEDE